MTAEALGTWGRGTDCTPAELLIGDAHSSRYADVCMHTHTHTPRAHARTSSLQRERSDIYLAVEVIGVKHLDQGSNRARLNNLFPAVQENQVNFLSYFTNIRINMHDNEGPGFSPWHFCSDINVSHAYMHAYQQVLNAYKHTHVRALLTCYPLSLQYSR